MKKSVIVPTSLNEITLGEMQAYERVQENLTPEERQIKAIEIFCGLSAMVVKFLPNNTVNEITEKLSSTLAQQPEFKTRFTIDGIEYGFIPNLDEITFGEFVDIESFQNKFSDLHKLMSILFRPIKETIGNRYLIEPYRSEVDASIMKRMPVGIAFGAQVFFWNLGIELLTSTMRSLEEEFRDIAQSTPSVKNGDGFQVYMDSLRATLDELMKSRPYPYINV
jgi:hypothetical protein